METAEMDEEHPSERANEPKPSLGDILKESTADALRVVTEMREPKVMGNAKQVIVGATLTTALAFLIALAAVPHLDTPLTIASYAVGFAVPLLFTAFMFATVEFGPGIPVFLANVLKVSSFVVSEGLGSLAVGVGLFLLLWHLSLGAAIAAVIAMVLGLLAPALVVLAIILRLVMLDRRAKARGEPRDPEALLRKSRFVSLFLEDTNKPSEATDAH
jgi:hypothetical protein